MNIKKEIEQFLKKFNQNYSIPSWNGAKENRWIKYCVSDNRCDKVSWFGLAWFGLAWAWLGLGLAWFGFIWENPQYQCR